MSNSGAEGVQSRQSTCLGSLDRALAGNCSECRLCCRVQVTGGRKWLLNSSVRAAN